MWKWLAIIAAAIAIAPTSKIMKDKSYAQYAARGGLTLNPQVKAATRSLSLAFLKDVFDGEDGVPVAGLYELRSERQQGRHRTPPGGRPVERAVVRRQGRERLQRSAVAGGVHLAG